MGRQTYVPIKNGALPFRLLIRRNRFDFSRDIVKEPNLTLFFDELAAHFPQARFAFVLRDPRDNIRSQLNRMRIAGNLPCLEPGHSKCVDAGFALLLDGRWCGIDTGNHYIEQLAGRWVAIADVYAKNYQRMHLIQYEQFLNNKVEAIEQLALQLGVRPIHNINDKVDIQFQEKGDNSASWIDFYGHENLSRIEHICAPLMQKFGYERSI